MSWTSRPVLPVMLSSCQRDPGEAGECLPRENSLICSDAFGRFSQDRAGLFRSIDLSSALTSTPRIWATARDGTTITQTLSDVAGAGVVATSARTQAVAGSALSAFDRELGTAWQAAPTDPQPALTLTLPQARTLRGIRLVNRVGLSTRRLRWSCASTLPGRRAPDSLMRAAYSDSIR